MNKASDLNARTVAQLRALARARGLRDYSRLRKAELIALLSAPRATDRTAMRRKASAPKHKPASAAATFHGPAAPDETPRTPEPPVRLTMRPAGRAAGADRVEESKYARAAPDFALSQTSMAPALAGEDGPLPALRDPRLVMMAQKPGIVHIYWTVPEDSSGDLLLRLGWITSSGEEKLLEEIRVAGPSGRHYFHLPEALDRMQCYAELGRRDAGRPFVSILPRATVHAPGRRPSPRADHQWPIGEAEFRNRYLHEREASRSDARREPDLPSSPFGRVDR